MAKDAWSAPRSLKVRIKPGTRDGQRIRLRDAAMPGTMGGAAGDLYIIVRVGEHPLFKREGDDIYLTVPVTLTEAALGAKVEVPTIDGRALLRIPPGTQPADRSCGCARKAFPRRRKKASVAMRSWRSRSLRRSRDERSKEILREFAKLNPEDPREELWKQVG